MLCKTCDSDSSSLQGALWCHSLSPNSSTGVIDHMRMGRQMLSFPTNLLTCCQLRGAMVTPGECGGVPERTPECGGCSHRYEMHPGARKVQHKGGYFKASDEPAYVISSVCFYFFSHPSSNIGLKYWNEHWRWAVQEPSVTRTCFHLHVCLDGATSEGHNNRATRLSSFQESIQAACHRSPAHQLSLRWNVSSESQRSFVWLTFFF